MLYIHGSFKFSVSGALSFLEDGEKNAVSCSSAGGKGSGKERCGGNNVAPEHWRRRGGEGEHERRLRRTQRPGRGRR
jgi:hypothetical protein